MSDLSNDQARKIALAAQGLASSPKRGKKAPPAQMTKVFDRLHLLQIDSVNVLSRSHYMPVFSRCGPYRRSDLDARTFTGQHRETFEYWAHEASLLPLRLHPYLRWRMNDAQQGIGLYKQLVRFAEEQPNYLRQTLDEVRSHGPLRASELPNAGNSTPADWWSWSKGKMALEYLFWTGLVTTAARLDTFERLYDVPERVIPADILNLPTPDKPDAIRHLMLLSAQALGIATASDLRDYFRLPLADSQRGLNELLEQHSVIQVGVDKWQKPAFMVPDTVIPDRVTASSLLTPFDPLVWGRQRTERIFGFRYRIEIYTPAIKRQYGYYVLPFLFKGQMAARLCLKADRKNGILLVNQSHAETGYKAIPLARSVISELQHLKGFLGLTTIKIMPQGNLSSDLKDAYIAFPD